MKCESCGAQVENGKCTYCGRTYTTTLENFGQSAETERYNYTAQNTITNGKPKDKYVSLLLCIFLGMFGAHKFYEGKIGMGILYFLTAGIFGIGWVVDIVLLIGKPRVYYV